MAACFYYFAIDLGHVITKQIQKLGSVIGTDLIADEIDVQDEWAIVDECAMQRAMQAMKQEKQPLQWLLTQHHDEVSMLVCDFKVEHVFSS
jgi:hypothetical protein